MQTMLSRFWNRETLRSSQRMVPVKPKNQFAVERLEDRRLAAVDIYFDDGIRGNGPDHPELRGVHIVGTDRADRIEITHQNGQLKVWAARPTGTGLVSVFDANDVPRIFFNGLGGNDVFTSNSSIETIAHGGAGDDDINGGWGRVELYGDSGNDNLHAGNLAYGVMLGGYGNDTLRSGARGMDLLGEEDDDLLVGGYGNDYLSGGSGNDFLFGREGNDSLSGNAGNDQLQGGDGNDKLWGQDGFDIVMGDAGRDTISGGADRDVLDGGRDEEVDEMFGDGGPDYFLREWRFDGGYIVYFDDATYDFSASQGDRFIYYDFMMFVTEWANMQFTDFLAAGGKVAGFTGPEDLFASEEAFELPSPFVFDPMTAILPQSISYEPLLNNEPEVLEFDVAVSILANDAVFDESIQPIHLVEESIVNEQALQDYSIIDAAINDFIVAPVIAQVNIVPSLWNKTSRRFF
jgi:hypothetical protein